MKEKSIFFLLIQIEEAHTDKWPQGVITLGKNHSDFSDRVARAQKFVSEELPDDDCFKVMVDPWNNVFAETFQAWPDKYYLINKDKVVLKKSTYGQFKDAVIDCDCLDLIYLL